MSVITKAAALAAVFIMAACATTENNGEDVAVVPQPAPRAASDDLSFSGAGVAQKQLAIPVAQSYQSAGAVMRHTLREMAEYDIGKMQKLINHEINMNEGNETTFLNQAATALGQTVLLQPDFTVRESALHDLKGRLDPEQYPLVLDKAADELLSIMTSSSAPSDQAGALIALTNLVTEVRTLKKAELRDILEKIADANLKVTPAARHYAVEPMEGLISPSLEAQSALKTL